jgi:hypothetical protein
MLRQVSRPALWGALSFATFAAACAIAAPRTPAGAFDTPVAAPTPCVSTAQASTVMRTSPAGVAVAAPHPAASAAPVAEPTCAPNIKRWSLKFAPDYGLSVGSGDNASFTSPQTAGLSSSYALTYIINQRTSDTDGEQIRLSAVRGFSNDYSDKVLRNLAGAFNARSINAITDTVKLTQEFDGPEVERYEVELGYAYRHPSCCGAANATFNPSGQFHRYYGSVDYYFGPIQLIGFQSDPKNPSSSRTFDILVQLSKGPHNTSTAYLQSLGPGATDQGAKTLLTVSPTWTGRIGSDPRNYVAVSYQHTEQYFDDTPKPIYFNDYSVTLKRDLNARLTLGLQLSSLTAQDNTRPVQLPNSLKHAAIDLIASWKVIP